jgi:diguanylate cyclase (GGDEF)-like protein
LTITALRHRDLTARMLDRVIYGILASNACFFGLLAAWIARSSSNDLQAEQWIGSQLMLVTYIGGTLMGLIAALAFVIALGMDLVEHHHKSSRIDPLTGLGNRRALDAFVDAQANGAHVFGAALMIDLDHFKAINDTHGHDAGDAVLGAVGLSLQTKLGVFAEITRVGGEEFAVLIRTPYADIAPSLALVARAAIIDAEPAAPHDALRVTASIGLARCAKHEELRAALRRADMALYAAKAGGRDRVIAEEDHNHRVELRAVA